MLKILLQDSALFEHHLGPKASEVLQAGVGIDLKNLKFMNGTTADILSATNCRITRCGYTGEDGFEVGNSHQTKNSIPKLCSCVLQNASLVG